MQFVVLKTWGGFILNGSKILGVQNTHEGTLLSNLTLNPSLKIGSSNYEESFLEWGPPLLLGKVML
jgi:hypothetical protein